MTQQSPKLPTDTHKHLELIRRLESGGTHLFATEPKSATAQAKHHEGSPLDRLIKRAELIDSDGNLKLALHKGKFLMNLANQSYSMVYFFLGFMGVLGLLGTQIVSFFYVLVGLLGWHTLTLVIWLIGLKRTHSYSALYLWFDKLKPKKPVEKTAFEIHLDEFKQADRWHVGAMVHRAWIFGLLGSTLALLMLFSFKSYAFVWESTLLSQQHFTIILAVLSAIPSAFGLDVPNHAMLTAGTATPRHLAILMMSSVVLYGMLPRLCTYIYCLVLSKRPFVIDKNLYYYENLLRQFNQTIVDKDDYTPALPKLAKTTINTGAKVVATLERSAPKDWYRLDNTNQIKEIGVIDNKDEIRQAISTANAMKAQIYLGIDPKSLPDRGMLRKFDTLLQDCQYGVVVAFVGEGDHLTAWHEALHARGVQEVSH